MPHHYLHGDVLEEHQAEINRMHNRGKKVCARCGNVVKGVHYVGRGATIRGTEVEGSDSEKVRLCPNCYHKTTGLNFGQFKETLD